MRLFGDVLAPPDPSTEEGTIMGAEIAAAPKKDCFRAVLRVIFFKILGLWVVWLIKRMVSFLLLFSSKALFFFVDAISIGSNRKCNQKYL